MSRRFVGLEIAGAPLANSNTTRWDVLVDGESVGYVTSAIYLPRLDKNIALALVADGVSAEGTECVVDTDGGAAQTIVVPKPFYDPKKAISTTS